MARPSTIAAILTAAALSCAISPAAQARKARPAVVDPACLASVPWAVNPAEVDLQLSGCRSPGELPAPDAEGWRSFDAPDGSRTQVHRDVIYNPRSRGITFRLRYNGGGSMTFAYTISGHPVVDNRLKAGSFIIQ